MVKTFTQHELQQCLEVSTKNTSKLSPIWTAAWDDIKSKPSLYGDFKLKDDEWNLEAEFFAGDAGIQTRKSARKINFSALKNSGFTDPDGVVRRVKRIIWIYLHSGAGSMSRAVQNSNFLLRLLHNIQPILIVQQHSKEDSCPDGPKLFSSLLQSDYERLEITTAHDGVFILNHVADQIDDHFLFRPTTYSNKRDSSKQAGNIVSLGAFSDEEITEILRQALYFSRLSDLIIDFEEWADPLRQQALNGKSGLFKKTSDGGVQLSLSDKWREEYQKSFLQPISDKFNPLGLLTEESFKYAFGDTATYTTLAEYNQKAQQSLASIIELTHRFLIAFFTGMRDQEIYALKHDCLRKITSEDYTRILGYDMKSDDSVQGAERDWPLPDLCVEIIHRQQKLNEIYHKQTDKLFNRSKVLTPHIKRFADNISLEDNDQMLKRMRPTIASLVLLASRSPVAVKAVLGHTDLDQTLGYARSNRNLQEEMIAQDTFVNRVLGRKILDNVKTGNAPQKVTNTVVAKTARFLGNTDAAKKLRIQS